MTKELEALDRIQEELTYEYDEDMHTIVNVLCEEELDVLKSALERKEKLETENAELKARNKKLKKVLEIFKEKKVDPIALEQSCCCLEYNDMMEDVYIYSDKYQLSEEEFNLLKEMLGENNESK